MDVSPLIRDGPGTGFEFREVPDAPVFSYSPLSRVLLPFYQIAACADSFRKYFAFPLRFLSIFLLEPAV